MDGVNPTDTIVTTHLLLLLLLLWLLLFRTPSISVYYMPLKNRMREWTRRKECERGETETEKEWGIGTEKKIETSMTMRLVIQNCVERKRKIVQKQILKWRKTISQNCQVWGIKITKTWYNMTFLSSFID